MYLSVLFQQVYGHVGDCRGRRTVVQPSLISNGGDGQPAGGDGTMPIGSSSSRGGSLSPREANTHLRSSKAVDGQQSKPVERLCVVNGDIRTTRNWYGFLRNLSLEAGGGYRFLFTYPSVMQVGDLSISVVTSARTRNPGDGALGPRGEPLVSGSFVVFKKGDRTPKPPTFQAWNAGVSKYFCHHC